MESINTLSMEEAVVAFYQPNSQDQAANEWLTSAKSSLEAWCFCWQLLQPDKSELIQFFGASTLHFKVKKHFHEVSSENRLELMQKIHEAIIRLANGPKIVLDRLCVALSVYLLQVLAECPSALEELVRDFQNRQIPNLSTDTQLGIMLQVLLAIPEEAPNVYSPVMRVRMRPEMGKNIQLVLQSAEQFIRMNRPWNAEACSRLNRAVQCIGNWCSYFGYALEDCVSTTSLLLEVTEKCMNSGEECMSDEETELAENCLKTLLNIVDQPNKQSNPQITCVFTKQILDAKLYKGNMEINKDLCSLIAATGMRHLGWLADISRFEGQLSPQLRQIIKALLECTEKEGYYPVDEKCSKEALPFWNLFQSKVLRLHEWEMLEEIWNSIKPLYTELTRILVRKAEQPDERSLAQWDSDDLEAFATYRQDISETLVCCYKVLEAPNMLQVLAEILDEAITDFQRSPTHWTRLEASIYSFKAVAMHVGRDQSGKIAKLIQVLNEIPYHELNPKLLGTALETVGSCGNWLIRSPSHLPLAIHLLVGGLNSSMAAEAALGIKELCYDSPAQLKPYVQPLLEALHASVCTGKLRESTLKEVMLNIGRLLCMLPVEEVPRLFRIIIGPSVDELQTICREVNKSDEARTRTINRINMISPLLKSFKIDLDEAQSGEKSAVHPLLQLLQALMPIFRNVVDLWIEDVDVLKAACSAVREAIMNLRDKFLPMFQELCQLIASSFQVPCCEANMGIAKTTIIVFYNNEDCRPVMQQLLQQFILHGFQVFENTPEENLSDIAETFEIFFGYLAEIVRKVPQILEDETLPVERLIFYGQKGMHLPEGGAIRGTTLFLKIIVVESRDYPHITQIVQATEEQILWTIMKCVGQLTPPSQVEKFADVFLAFNRTFPTETANTMFSLMAKPDFPTPIFTDRDKIIYTGRIVIAKDKKTLLEQLSDMAIRARGLEKLQ